MVVSSRKSPRAVLTTVHGYSTFYFRPKHGIVLPVTSYAGVPRRSNRVGMSNNARTHLSPFRRPNLKHPGFPANVLSLFSVSAGKQPLGFWRLQPRCQCTRWTKYYFTYRSEKFGRNEMPRGSSTRTCTARPRTAVHIPQSNQNVQLQARRLTDNIPPLQPAHRAVTSPHNVQA